MEKNKSKIKLTLILVIVTLAILLISNFIVSFISENIKTTASKLESDGEVSPKELVDENSIEGTCGEFEVTEFNERNIGMSTGRLLYCIEHGANTHNSGETLHMDVAEKYGDRKGNYKVWPKTHGYCRPFENNGEITYPYFECVNNHRDLLAEGNADAAYIVTYPPADQWTLEKQYALWRTGINIGNDLSSGKSTSPDKKTDEEKDPVAYAKSGDIYDEAQKYKSFHEKTHQNGGDSDLGIKNETDKDNLRTSVDQAEQSYKMGPVSIDYNYGAEDGVTFGGISDMYAIGYNSKGEIVPGKDRIEIGKYYDQNGTGYELSADTYFQPNMDDKSYVDYGEQVYPKGISGGEDEFYFEFSNPNTDIDYTLENYEDYIVSYVKIHIDFQWMECASCVVCELDCAKYEVSWECKDNNKHCHGHTGTNGSYTCGGCCYYCTAKSKLIRHEIQKHISVLEGSRKLYKSSLEMGGPSDFTLRMQLAGYVWVDGGLDNKENTPYNGVSGDSKDVALPNTKVILYNASGTKVAEKLTDDAGCYIFTVDPMGKYYVAFEYNGQLYVPTTYNKPEYNSDDWKKTSKATEKDSDRDALNEKFAKIEAYPKNYSGGKVYSMQQLVEDQVIDSFFKIENGIIVETDDLNKASKNPDADQQKFIDDCKILAYTKSREVENINSYDLYPVKDKFVINTKQYFNTGSDARNASFDTTSKVFSGTEYVALYPGQFYIDLGLVRRKINDLALKKDVFRAATKINGKTEVYKYSRSNDDDNKNWDISVRLSDAAYYEGIYNREVFKSDWNYNPNESYNGSDAHGGSALEVFVTYKITLRNQSRGILNTIDEVADYFDKEYKYREDLSWVTYGDNGFNDNEYFKAIDKESAKSEIKNYKEVDSKEENGVVYVHGLKNNKLAPGEKECIYLTFQVNKESNKVILDQSESDAKYNVAEINGYTSYYKDDTELPNGVTKGSSDYAGLIDIDSVPGNVDKNDLQNEKDYEDDTDRAKGLRVFYDDSKTRKINGIVWEDLRTEIIEESIIGNGLKDEENTGISDIKVELVEKLANNKEYVWKTTTLNEKNQEKTDSTGKYLFENYIPGDYVVRFTYGGDYNAKYNGQDYKSTTYQKGITQDEITNKAAADLGKTAYNGYTDIENQNKFGSYGYDIAKLNDAKVSDAKDIWSYRETVNKYSSNNYSGVTNELAQKLSENEKSNNDTKMVAETGVIAIEVEYNRVFTENEGNEYHIKDVDLGLTERPKAQLELNKHIENVKLTLANGTVLYDAKTAVPNLSWTKGEDYKLIENNKYYQYNKANSKYKYNTNQNEINNLVGSLYQGTGNSKKNGLIQAIVDSELMHGATIRIEYKLTLKNVGETDYTGKAFYYTGVKSGDVTTTSGDIIVDYVSNNLQYRTVDNNDWETTDKNSLSVSDGVKTLIKNNTIITTTKLKEDLKPKDSVEGNLVLTQTITAQNSSDDMTYDNIAEIMQYSNTVGRRMAYSVVGNQNPNDAPTEVDSAKAEKVIILPPFGQTYLYFGIGIVAVAVLAIGIIVIKKKVLKK